MDHIGLYASLVGLGLLPSAVWLVFFLKRDCHPEPKSVVARTFLMGMLVAPIALLVQLALKKFGPTAEIQTFFFLASFAEECVKLYAVKVIALNNAAFDEPVDAMIYMIAAALGFAAVENMLILLQVIPDGINIAIGVLSLRFIGATLLHALSSGLLGYFLAMSWFHEHHRKKLVIFGLIYASLFHAMFNVLISTFTGQLRALGYATALLVFMAFLVSILFDKVRDRGIPKIEN